MSINYKACDKSITIPELKKILDDHKIKYKKSSKKLELCNEVENLIKKITQGSKLYQQGSPSQPLKNESTIKFSFKFTLKNDNDGKTYKKPLSDELKEKIFKFYKKYGLSAIRYATVVKRVKIIDFNIDGNKIIVELKIPKKYMDQEEVIENLEEMFLDPDDDWNHPIKIEKELYYIIGTKI